MVNALADYMFEASWEVCNKVGGIYTVLTSKVEQMQSYYRNYYLIGPYFENNSRIELTESPPPVQFKQVFDDLQRENIKCHFGTWEDVKGRPNVILVEFMGVIDQKNYIKEMFWNDYKIDSLRGYWDFEEPLLWSYCVGKLIASLKDKSLVDKRVVAQFHEWLSAFGLLYLKKYCRSVGTVFTTHATVLGRTLAANGIDLYHNLNSIEPLSEAYRFIVEAKHLTEKAAALNADVFTTVSEITGIESERFLSRKPDILLFNGLDIAQFPSFEDISIKHRISRDKIREFLTYFYFPYYTFNIDNNLIFYTIGRYEYKNKGYDILIKSLGKLNEQLKKDSASSAFGPDADVASNIPASNMPASNIHTITVFFWIPIENHGLKTELLENKNCYMHIKNYVNNNGADILTRMVYDMLAKKDDVEQELIHDTFSTHLKKDLIAFERKGNPPFSTHNIDESNNSLVIAFRQNGLLNRKEDMVKVIIEPVYLDGNDGFIDLTYYDAIIGCHLGLFASYYEPWGYTPLESVALGVPALTTDLSGFGAFIKNHDARKEGVYLLERLNKPENKVVDEFTNIMLNFSRFTKQQRIDAKLNAKNFSSQVDWKIFAENYVNAHNMALTKVGR